jgi:hypothetical protein
MSYSELQMERHQAREAHESLKTALADIDAYFKAHPQAASTDQLVADLKQRLAQAANRMEREAHEPKPPGKGGPSDPLGPPPDRRGPDHHRGPGPGPGRGPGPEGVLSRGREGREPPPPR